VVDDAIDYREVAKEGDDLHRAPAVGAEQGIDFVDFTDHLGPAFGRDAPELVLDNPERKRPKARLLDLPSMGVGVEAEISDCHMTPMDDLDFNKLTTYDHTKKLYTQSNLRYYANRPTTQVNFLVDYFVDRFLGFSHDVKLGAELRDSKAEHWSHYAGGLFLYTNWSLETADITGDGVPDVVPNLNRLSMQRQSQDNSKIRDYSGFISDTLTAGHITS